MEFFFIFVIGAILGLVFGVVFGYILGLVVNTFYDSFFNHLRELIMQKRTCDTDQDTVSEE